MSMLDKVDELHGQFESLLEHAQHNETALKKFRDFEIALLFSDNPAEFFNSLLKNYHQAFAWDQVTVTLVDANFDIRRLFSHLGNDLESNPDILFLDSPAPLKKVYRDCTTPVLGPFDPEEHETFFPGGSAAPASVALLPIIRRHVLIGSFNIGSMNADRFQAQGGKDFLQHLAAIISVCIDNLLTKEYLKYLGLVDNLTGVNNRRYFEQRLQEETARVFRTNAPLSCLFVDVDHFKKINDEHGHQSGDQVLRHVAQVIREQVRSIDIVARYGGEEFTVLLLQAAAARAQEIAERIRSTLAETTYYTDDGRRIALSVSIGVNTLPPGETPANLSAAAKGLVEGADQALYAAKNSGRNRTVSYSRQPKTGDKPLITGKKE